VGIIGSSLYDVSRDVSLQPGESANINGYTLVYRGLSGREVPDKVVVSATLDVYRGDRLVTTVVPEKYFHRSFEQPVSEVAIHTSALEDLYVILIGWDASDTASFSLLVNPLVVWLWVGGGILVIGGVIAFWPERRRKAIVEEAPAAVPESAAIEDEIEKRVRQLRGGKGGFCPQCGTPFRPGDRFCSRCGADLAKEIRT
jgi:cytochrome c biogenesis factor